MNRSTFIFALCFSLGYVLMCVAEAGMYASWDAEATQQRELEAHLIHADHVNEFARQLVQRIAVDSLRDPALTEVLKKNGLQVMLPVSEKPPAPVPGDSSTPTTDPSAIDHPTTSAPPLSPIPANS